MIPPVRLGFMLPVLFIAVNALGAAPSLSAIDAAIAAADYGQALELIDAGLARTPENVALRFRRARVHSYTGDQASALRDLDALRDEYPRDVDFAFARAQSLAQLGRDDAALNDLREATRLAPEYEAVWKLRYTLLSRQHSTATRIERDLVKKEIARRFPQASWRELAEHSDEPQWTVLAGAVHEDLDHGLPSWNREFLEITRKTESAASYRAGLARDERFGVADLSMMLGAGIELAKRWRAEIGIVYVDGADFQPELSLNLLLGKSLDNGWATDIRYQRRNYAAATVSMTTAGVEKYAGDFRIAYSLGIAHLHGASNSLNQSLTVNWYYREHSSIGIRINRGDEAESIGPGRVLETPVRGASIMGRREISERLSLDWWLGLHEQGDFYRRQFLGMAVSIRF